MKLNKTLRVLSVVLCFFGFPEISAAQYKPVPDMLKPVIPMHMQGHIVDKLNQSYNNRILVQDVDHLIKPFRERSESRMWQSEFWGKWFTSAVLAYRFRPDKELRLVLDKAVKDLIATQTPDGYIGNYAKESRLMQWDIWGRKYCMLGLLDYAELTGDKASLQAAKKLADHLILEIKQSKDGLIISKGNYRGMAASSVLEPFVKLFRMTNQDKYLDFAKKIVKEWELPEGPMLLQKAGLDVAKRFPSPTSWYSYEQGQKAYEMMSCYEGLLELYRVTGQEDYLNAVVKTWENIRDTEMNIVGSGASEEMWFGGKQKQSMPITHYQETCVSVTWVKLSLQLFRLTGEARYAEEIEKTYYNVLLASLNADGSDWAKYTPLFGERLPGSGQCGMDLNCCNASGPRGQFILPSHVIMESKQGISINFYIDGQYKVQIGGKDSITLAMNTQYPIDEKVRLSMAFKGERTFPLRLRIPAWSEDTKLKVNGKPVEGLHAGEYIELTRNWSSADIIELTFDMRGRLHELKDGNRKYLAIQRGPIILARDSRLSGSAMTTINRPVANKNGIVELTLVEPLNDNIWMQFEADFIPESFTETGAKPIKIQLCDYASAGNGREKSAFYIWLQQLFSGRVQSINANPQGKPIY